MEEDRNLTDDDVKAVVDELEGRMINRFYVNLGMGIWAAAWRAIVVLIFALAALGAAKKGGFF